MTKVYWSKCCNAKVKTGGMPDFLKSNEISTAYYVCIKCNKPCDIMKPENRKDKIYMTDKSKIIELKLNDDIEIRLTKEGRKIYGEYCKKYRHNPLKKTSGCWVRVQLWEFMNIFGSRMFMGAPNVIVGGTIRIPKP